jgi:hypothetical protein
MLITTFALAALALPASAPAAAPSAAAATTLDDHGKLPWFEGTYEELLAKAKAEDKIIFLDFWTSW